MVIYHVFGFFWGYAFLQGINQLTIAGSFATYYWTLDKRAIRASPITKSFWRTVRYHLGSIALGSLLLSIVQILKLITNLARKKLASKSNNKVIVWCLGCISCCMGVLEKIVKWINKNAYIKIAIDGKSFCKSCTSAFWLLVRHALKLLAVDYVTDVLLFMSKLNITAGTALLAYVILNAKKDEMQLKFIFVPVAVIAIEAFVVASAFLSVYHMGIDTIFLSFLEDLDRNDGSPEKPYYMSDELKHILHVSNEKVGFVLKIKCERNTRTNPAFFPLIRQLELTKAAKGGVAAAPTQPRSKRVVPVDEF
jgi:hypothetical protein